MRGKGRSQVNPIKRAVLREWDQWSGQHSEAAKTSTGGALFFNHLQCEQPDLLDFKAGAVDKWQIIHGWLLSEGRVSD